MASVFQTAVTQALYNQPWYIRRKDSLAATAGLVLQVLNGVAGYGSDMPEWANLLIAALIGLCQILIHARTPGAITPSQAARLEDAANLAAMERPSQSGYIVAQGETVTVEDATTTSDAFAAGIAANQGEGWSHRAD